MARSTRIQTVFLNVPYDKQFEKLYLAYIVGLTQLGMEINATLAVPNQGRLQRIIRLIKESNVSLHDLSRTELSRGTPRFNMPLELGLALYRSHTHPSHRVFVFERKAYRALRSTSDINGIDAQIHGGTITGVMSSLRNIFYQPDGTTVPQMLASYRAVSRRLPEFRRKAGSKSLFEASIFQDLIRRLWLSEKSSSGLEVRNHCGLRPNPGQVCKLVHSRGLGVDQERIVRREWRNVLLQGLGRPGLTRHLAVSEHGATVPATSLGRDQSRWGHP